MKEGYWIRTSDGKTWQVGEHCSFAKSPAGAAAMGLSPELQQEIAPMPCDFNGTGREGVLLAVMKAGYIRMRGHGAQFTFEFWGDAKSSLWVIFEFCQQQAGPFTYLTINNLKSNEQYASSFQDFEKRMKEDEEEVLRIASTLLKNPAQLGSAGG